MRKLRNLVYAAAIICILSIFVQADALSNEQQLRVDRENLCKDYATGNPAQFVSDYIKKEEEENKRLANSNSLPVFTFPRYSNEKREFWTNQMNNYYDNDSAPTIGVQIVVCAEAKEPRLLIPPKLSAFIRKDLQNLEVKENAGIGTARTIAVGVFLSLAFVFGGVWLMRSPKSKNVKINVALGGMILGMLITAAAVAFPNLGGGDLSNKQTFLRDLQTYNISRDYDVRFYVMENNSDLDEVVLIVPLRTPRILPNTNVRRSNTANSNNKLSQADNSINANRKANSNYNVTNK